VALMETANRIDAQKLSGYACKLPRWVDALPPDARADAIALIANRKYSSEVVREALEAEYGFVWGSQMLRNHRNGSCRHCSVVGRTW
jgi:hypothetical protein